MKRLLLLVLCSCAGERQALKGATWPALGAATGAAVGSLAGPAGMIGGAAIGGASGHMLGENAALRTGELQGEGAADSEAIRWRGEAIKQTGAADYFKEMLRRVLWGVAAYLAYRNREHLIEAVKQRSIRPLVHALLGGARTRAG